MEAEDQILNILASLGLLVDDEEDEEELGSNYPKRSYHEGECSS